MKKQQIHLLMLLVATFFWGTTFVAQSLGADYVGPCTYLMARTWMAVAILPVVILLRNRAAAAKGQRPTTPQTPAERKELALAGLICGTSLFAASFLQQLGMAYTTAGKASFLTALYVVVVPIYSIFLGRRPGLQLWASVALAVIGLYLLCIRPGEFSVAPGDMIILSCSFVFSVQIMFVDRYSPRLDPLCFTWAMFLAEGIEATIGMALTEPFVMENFLAALPAIAYAGIFSSCVAYTLQVWGQEGVNPAHASIVMSLESVFGALSGWLFLGERMGAREMFGAVLMFGAILFSQLPLPSRKKTGNRA